MTIVNVYPRHYKHGLKVSAESIYERRKEILRE